MLTVSTHLKSISPYSQSRMHDTEKKEKETHADYDVRTWREHLHYDEQGCVFIPGMAFKQAIDKTASMLGRKVPGKRAATFAKYFLSGCLPMIHEVPIFLPKEEMEDGKKVIVNAPLTKEDAIRERIFANLDGRRGSAKRGHRHYPTFKDWQAIPQFMITDATITKPVFEEHLTEAGKFVGIGRFRAEVGGLYGKFEVEKFVWSEA